MTFSFFVAVEDVAAEAVAVGERRLLFEDAAVDAAAEVLDEIAVNQRVDVADDALGVDFDARAQRRGLAAEDEGRGADQSELPS